MLPEAKLRQRCDGAAVTETFLKCCWVAAVTHCYQVITEMLLGASVTPCYNVLRKCYTKNTKHYTTLKGKRYIMLLLKCYIMLQFGNNL